MKVWLMRAPWSAAHESAELMEAINIISANVWKQAASLFYARREAKLRHGVSAPKGIQPFLNEILEKRFNENGWMAVDGRFRKEDTWVRVTFRHQMSLGSDILESIKVFRKEQVKQVAIFAASQDFLRIISPNDANALVSFEKLSAEISDLQGVLDLPLFIGRLEPLSILPKDIYEEICKKRLRDRQTPVR